MRYTYRKPSRAATEAARVYPDPVYVVCDRCGFFYGDVRLVGGSIKCPDCGHEAAWAFPSIMKAFEYQAQVWDANSKASA